MDHEDQLFVESTIPDSRAVEEQIQPDVAVQATPFSAASMQRDATQSALRTMVFGGNPDDPWREVYQQRLFVLHETCCVNNRCRLSERRSVFIPS